MYSNHGKNDLRYMYTEQIKKLPRRLQKDCRI